MKFQKSIIALVFASCLYGSLASAVCSGVFDVNGQSIDRLRLFSQYPHELQLINNISNIVKSTPSLLLSDTLIQSHIRHGVDSGLVAGGQLRITHQLAEVRLPAIQQPSNASFRIAQLSAWARAAYLGAAVAELVDACRSGRCLSDLEAWQILADGEVAGAIVREDLYRHAIRNQILTPSDADEEIRALNFIIDHGDPRSSQYQLDLVRIVADQKDPHIASSRSVLWDVIVKKVRNLFQK